MFRVTNHKAPISHLECSEVEVYNENTQVKYKYLKIAVPKKLCWSFQA